MPNADTPSRSLFPRLQRAIFPDMVSNFEVEYIAGGATQNSARVAQWMLGEAGSVTYMGCVGKDEFAAKVRALWRGLKGGSGRDLSGRSSAFPPRAPADRVAAMLAARGAEGVLTAGF